VATVIGKTSDRINQLLAPLLVALEIDSYGSLLSTSHDGTITRVGQIVGTDTALTKVQSILASSRRGAVKIAFLGSSTTAGVGATTVSSSYVAQLTRAIQASYPSLVEGWSPSVVTLASAAASVPTLPGVHPINGGVSGTTSANYVSSTAISQLTTVAPHFVVHMIGANDYALNVDPAEFKNNLNSAIASLNAAIPSAYHLIADTYARPDISAPAYPWADYVAIMSEVASETANAMLLETTSEWTAAGVDGFNPPDPQRLTDWRLGSGGGIHPSDSGHAFMSNVLAQQLQLPPAKRLLTPDVFDRFQRFTLGSSETGQPWEQQSGTHISDGGSLKVTAGGNAVVSTGFSDCEVSALITHNAAVVPGIIAKSNDATTRIGAFLNGPSNRVEAYVGTTIIGWTTGISLVSGREYHLRLSVAGSAVRVELDGVLVLSPTLTSTQVTDYANYKKHGVRCSTANVGVKWRNFAVRAL
jgi:lysophospholipase L1-like esterase